MTDADAQGAFGALANADRLATLRLLIQAGPQGLSAGDVATALSASPSRTSFHLSALAEAGLIAGQREARRMVYTVEFAQLGALVAYLLEDCCKGHPQVMACCGLRSS